MNYFSLSFRYYEFYDKVLSGRYRFQIGHHKFPEDIEKLDKAYNKNPGGCLSVASFVLMRVEEIVKAAFMLNGYPAAHQYSWPSGDLYYDTTSEKELPAVIDDIEQYIGKFGIHVDAGGSCMLNEERLSADSHKLGSGHKTRKEYIDDCAVRGYCS